MWWMPTTAYVLSSTTQYEKEQVVNLFHRKSNFTNTVIKDTVGMEEPWRYRNKSQIPVGLSKDQLPIMGFYRQRSHDIIDMDSCLIQDQQHQQVMNDVKQLISDLNISVYNEKLKRTTSSFSSENRSLYESINDYTCDEWKGIQTSSSYG